MLRWDPGLMRRPPRPHPTQGSLQPSGGNGSGFESSLAGLGKICEFRIARLRTIGSKFRMRTTEGSQSVVANSSAGLIRLAVHGRIDGVGVISQQHPNLRVAIPHEAAVVDVRRANEQLLVVHHQHLAVDEHAPRAPVPGGRFLRLGKRGH